MGDVLKTTPSQVEKKAIKGPKESKKEKHDKPHREKVPARL